MELKTEQEKLTKIIEDQTVEVCYGIPITVIIIRISCYSFHLNIKRCLYKSYCFY